MIIFTSMSCIFLLLSLGFLGGIFYRINQNINQIINQIEEHTNKLQAKSFKLKQKRLALTSSIDITQFTKNEYLEFRRLYPKLLGL